MPANAFEQSANDPSLHQFASLAAGLIGTHVPVNNIGVVPLSFLSGSEKRHAELLLANAKQVCDNVPALSDCCGDAAHWNSALWKDSCLSRKAVMKGVLSSFSRPQTGMQ